MPRKRQPNTLVRSCLDTITLSFDLLCYGIQDLEEMKNLLANDTYRNIKGPFTDWPGSILYEIFEAISERYTLSKKHLHMLIQPQLQMINLSFGMGDVVSGFPLIQERCQMLGMIGKHCKEVAYLNLSGTSITDRGLVHLALAEDGTRQSQKLTRLIVSETWVSYGGAAVVLVYIPELREFEFEKILEALELVYNWCPALELTLLTRAGARMGETPTLPPYCLRLNTILSSADVITDKTLEAAVNLCPDIITFSISNAQISNEHLYKLMVLDNLTSLSLTNFDNLTIDFETGVLPVLSACGEHIKNLILTNFTYVSVPDIGRTCPKIQNIAFSKVTSFYQDTPHPEWFNDLEAMELWAETDIDLDPNLIKQLVVFSPKIKNLLFNSCHALTDKLFAEIMEENPMKSLSHLTLDHCFQISSTTLNAILDAENNLSVLRVWSCPNVGKENRSQIALRIDQENMDIYFDWYQYEPDF
ncbi:uncharacterized protein LOC142323417 isoform X3 [Lycorma delicatula]|uniref:uncharacterized protein LOC142323417 isoform X3 n=1 Tax=Lycorma delicatula TaxID=130591 RepID=UPI003F50FE58